MAREAGPHSERKPWPMLILQGAGIFLGGFWSLQGFWFWREQPASWWHYLSLVCPGAAVLILALRAKVHPLPYGAALIFLGLLPFCIWPLAGHWVLRLAFGLPVIALGLGFIGLRNFAEVEW